MKAVQIDSYLTSESKDGSLYKYARHVTAYY